MTPLSALPRLLLLRRPPPPRGCSATAARGAASLSCRRSCQARTGSPGATLEAGLRCSASLANVASSAGGHITPMQNDDNADAPTRTPPLSPSPSSLEARPLLKVQKGTALILRAVFAALSPRPPSRTTVADRAGGHLNSAMRYSIRPPVVLSLLLPPLTPSSLEARPLPKVQKEPGATLEVGHRLLRPGATRPAVENGASGHQGRPFIAAAPRGQAARPPGPPPSAPAPQPGSSWGCHRPPGPHAPFPPTVGEKGRRRPFRPCGSDPHVTCR